MASTNVIDDYSDEDVKRILERLVLCLPNNGKLYKYRPISGDTFEKAYDALENGYIWLSSADKLNDDEDCILFYDPKSEAVALEEYIESHVDLIARYSISQTKLPQIDFFDCTTHVFDCIDKETGRIKKKKALAIFVKHGYDREKSKEFICRIQKLIDDILKEKTPIIQSMVDKYLQFNQINRSRCFVHSFSETYNSNSMWALYADSNNGFCIEYDYNKALELPTDIQKTLICTYKTIYKEEKEPFSFIGILDFVFKNQQNGEDYKKANYDFMTKMITKRSDWSYEKEWRIFLTEVENRLNADIVSAIIIDERIIDAENAKKLIDLCRLRGWDVKVRMKNRIQTDHEFIPYTEWKNRRKKNA